MQFHPSITRRLRSVSLPIVALAALFVYTQPSSAQAPRYPVIPIDAKGYQAAMIRMQYFQAREAATGTSAPTRTAAGIGAAAHAQQPVAPTSWQVTVRYGPSQPNAAPVPISVAIRGPDGKAQSFPIEGEADAVLVRSTTVRPARGCDDSHQSDSGKPIEQPHDSLSLVVGGAARPRRRH